MKKELEAEAAAKHQQETGEKREAVASPQQQTNERTQ